MSAEIDCICSVVYDLADAFMDHPLATVMVWGPGFSGYDNGLTLPENLRQRYPCGKLDFIFVFLGEWRFLKPTMCC